MKLIRITHIRCGDYDCTTYAMAPDDWSVEKVEGAVYDAQSDFLKTYFKAKEIKDGPPNPGFNPPYDKFPDKTVAEVKKEYQKLKEEYDNWVEEYAKTNVTFNLCLERSGFTLLYNASKDEDEVELDWGHNHGEVFGYHAEEEQRLPSVHRILEKKEDLEWE